MLSASPETRSHLGRGAFTPDNEDGVGGEKGVLRVGVLRGRAVEKQQVGKIEKAAADFCWICRFSQRFHQRREISAHPPAAPRPRFPAVPPRALRDRCVSFTCSDFTSSGGVR